MDGTGEQHAGGVVTGEDVGALDEPRGHHHHAGPGLHEAFGGDGVASLIHGDPVVVVAAGDRRVDEDLHVGMGLARRAQFGCSGALGIITPAEMAT